MPRAKPSSVKTIRYELGSWERTHLEPVLHATALDKYSEAIGYLLDWQKLYLGVTLIEVVTGYEILYGTPNDLGDIVRDVRDWWQANKERWGGDLRGFIADVFSRDPPTPEEIARLQSQAEVWANAFGISVDPATGEVSEYTAPVYTSPGDVWMTAFGLDPADYQ